MVLLELGLRLPFVDLGHRDNTGGDGADRPAEVVCCRGNRKSGRRFVNGSAGMAPRGGAHWASCGDYDRWRGRDDRHRQGPARMGLVERNKDKEALVGDGDKSAAWTRWTVFHETNLRQGYGFPGFPAGLLARVTGRLAVWPFTTTCLPPPLPPARTIERGFLDARRQGRCNPLGDPTSEQPNLRDTECPIRLRCGEMRSFIPQTDPEPACYTGPGLNFPLPKSLLRDASVGACSRQAPA